ncbi:hypothetical protein LPB72_01505 [Hydrogenophaga crassostreae]|uniref:Uncharacterized protein n=1 Tax=Hydrogenophaga crassostreae TaxID=1763535 RepID=A0A162PE95_9BURK|nr:hypothetical protein [Hydrogenophaga crassostreae]AOW13839.1 hypothetical protein LPB072_14310 [Hydrogenophaga crassostreae]OAD44197.1 hypothetical protein LPB72_01505 [Hydrogenophaga crassostreae]
MSSTQPDVKPLFTGAWEGRNFFGDLIRQALETAANERWKLVVLSDPDFADWPLGERAVVDALQKWASKGRQLHFLARDFRFLQARAPRLVQWRVTWDHLVQARACQGAAAEALPSAIWSGEWTLERLDLVHARGVATNDPKRRIELRERLDACWQQGAQAFPASTLGL